MREKAFGTDFALNLKANLVLTRKNPLPFEYKEVLAYLKIDDGNILDARLELCEYPMWPIFKSTPHIFFRIPFRNLIYCAELKHIAANTAPAWIH